MGQKATLRAAAAQQHLVDSGIGKELAGGSASICPTLSPSGPSGLSSWAEDLADHGKPGGLVEVAELLHVMVSALGGAGTSGTLLLPGGRSGSECRDPHVGQSGDARRTVSRGRRRDRRTGLGGHRDGAFRGLLAGRRSRRGRSARRPPPARCVFIGQRYAHARRNVAPCPTSCAGPDSPPTDELECAEATFSVLQHVLHGLSEDDESKQTPCREFDVAKLTDHLMNSITAIGGAAGAQLPERHRATRWSGTLCSRPGLRWTRGSGVAWTGPSRWARTKHPPT